MRFDRSKIFILLGVAGAASLLAMPDSPGLVENAISPAALERARSALPAGNAGSFSVVTYNVAGLPDFLSRSHPSANVPRMGPLLSRYDLALVQEDFVYSGELRAGISLPFQSEPMRARGLLGVGDGLSRFSRFPFAAPRREPWNTCHGYFINRSDCLASKGFSATTHYVGRDAELDVYNLHMEAGRSPGDRRTRLAQVRQLLAALQEKSAGRAVIVAGDTNLKDRDKTALQHLLQAGGLRDACEVSDCPDVHEGIDKVLYRSSPSLELVPADWRVDDRFSDDRGNPLSDHPPIAVEFRWRSL